MKRFTKKALPLAIAAAMVPGFASAADVSGFADIIYTIGDDNSATGGTTGTEGKFTAEGEIDFTASPADGVTVRMDVDVMAGGASLEQAYFAWGATEGVTVLGGIINNPIGAEAEDAPDMWGTNHGVVYNILDNQTALDGDNVAGLAGAFAVGPATVTVALLNDLQQVDEENSMAVVVNMSPMEGLDLELGVATQETGAEGVTNINLAYATPVEGLSIGLDYLMADEVVDAAYEISANYSMDALGFGVRMENVDYSAGDEESNSRTTFHVSYAVASNLTAILEVADGTVDETTVTGVDGIAADGVTTLELIATF